MKARVQFNGPKKVGPLQAQTAQPKTINRSKPHPVAPPPYTPQSTPKVLQRKSIGSPLNQVASPKQGPPAPPVYRPQPLPKVLQGKMATQPARAGQPKPVQAKIAGTRTAMQMKPNASASFNPATSASARTSLAAQNRVVQKKMNGPGAQQPLRQVQQNRGPVRPQVIQ